MSNRLAAVDNQAASLLTCSKSLASSTQQPIALKDNVSSTDRKDDKGAQELTEPQRVLVNLLLSVREKRAVQIPEPETEEAEEPEQSTDKGRRLRHIRNMFSRKKRSRGAEKLESSTPDKETKQAIEKRRRVPINKNLARKSKKEEETEEDEAFKAECRTELMRRLKDDGFGKHAREARGKSHDAEAVKSGRSGVDTRVSGGEPSDEGHLRPFQQRGTGFGISDRHPGRRDKSKVFCSSTTPLGSDILTRKKANLRLDLKNTTAIVNEKVDGKVLAGSPNKSRPDTAIRMAKSSQISERLSSDENPDRMANELTESSQSLKAESSHSRLKGRKFFRKRDWLRKSSMQKSVTESGLNSHIPQSPGNVKRSSSSGVSPKAIASSSEISSSPGKTPANVDGEGQSQIKPEDKTTKSEASILNPGHVDLGQTLRTVVFYQNRFVVIDKPKPNSATDLRNSGNVQAISATSSSEKCPPGEKSVDGAESSGGHTDTCTKTHQTSGSADQEVSESLRNEYFMDSSRNNSQSASKQSTTVLEPMVSVVRKKTPENRGDYMGKHGKLNDERRKFGVEKEKCQNVSNTKMLPFATNGQLENRSDKSSEQFPPSSFNQNIDPEKIRGVICQTQRVKNSCDMNKHEAQVGSEVSTSNTFSITAERKTAGEDGRGIMDDNNKMPMGTQQQGSSPRKTQGTQSNQGDNSGSVTTSSLARAKHDRKCHKFPPGRGKRTEFDGQDNLASCGRTDIWSVEADSKKTDDEKRKGKISATRDDSQHHQNEHKQAYSYTDIENNEDKTRRTKHYYSSRHPSSPHHQSGFHSPYHAREISPSKTIDQRKGTPRHQPENPSLYHDRPPTSFSDIEQPRKGESTNLKRDHLKDQATVHRYSQHVSEPFHHQKHVSPRPVARQQIDKQKYSPTRTPTDAYDTQRCSDRFDDFGYSYDRAGHSKETTHHLNNYKDNSSSPSPHQRQHRHQQQLHQHEPFVNATLSGEKFTIQPTEETKPIHLTHADTHFQHTQSHQISSQLTPQEVTRKDLVAQAVTQHGNSSPRKFYARSEYELSYYDNHPNNHQHDDRQYSPTSSREHLDFGRDMRTDNSDIQTKSRTLHDSRQSHQTFSVTSRNEDARNTTRPASFALGNSHISNIGPNSKIPLARNPRIPLVCGEAVDSNEERSSQIVLSTDAARRRRAESNGPSSPLSFVSEPRLAIARPPSDSTPAPLEDLSHSLPSPGVTVAPRIDKQTISKRHKKAITTLASSQAITSPVSSTPITSPLPKSRFTSAVSEHVHSESRPPQSSAADKRTSDISSPTNARRVKRHTCPSSDNTKETRECESESVHTKARNSTTTREFKSVVTTGERGRGETRVVAAPVYSPTAERALSSNHGVSTRSEICNLQPSAPTTISGQCFQGQTQPQLISSSNRCQTGSYGDLRHEQVGNDRSLKPVKQRTSRCRDARDSSYVDSSVVISSSSTKHSRPSSPSDGDKRNITGKNLEHKRKLVPRAVDEKNNVETIGRINKNSGDNIDTRTGGVISSRGVERSLEDTVGATKHALVRLDNFGYCVESGLEDEGKYLPTSEGSKTVDLSPVQQGGQEDSCTEDAALLTRSGQPGHFHYPPSCLHRNYHQNYRFSPGTNRTRQPAKQVSFSNVTYTHLQDKDKVKSPPLSPVLANHRPTHDEINSRSPRKIANLCGVASDTFPDSLEAAGDHSGEDKISPAPENAPLLPQSSSSMDGRGIEIIVSDENDARVSTVHSGKRAVLRRIWMVLLDNRVAGRPDCERALRPHPEEYRVLKRVLNIIFVTIGVALLISVFVVIIYTHVLDIDDWDDHHDSRASKPQPSQPVELTTSSNQTLYTTVQSHLPGG